MKGTLTKTEKGWVVNYNYSVNNNDWCTILLHPTDVEQISKDSQVFDNIEARIAAYPEVEFEIFTEWENGEVGVNGLTYAKLIHHPVETNKMIDHIGEVNEMANHVPDVGKMVEDDVEKEKHPSVFSENGNELFFDKEGNLIKEVKKDNVEKLAEKQFPYPKDIKDKNDMIIKTNGIKPFNHAKIEKYRRIWSQGYNKAKETLYTEEQLREAMIEFQDWSFGLSADYFKEKYQSEMTEIIQSLKQPKQ